jgi:hypothetical protein
VLCRSEKPVDGKPADDGYPCELCGAWIDYCDLGKLLGHEVFAAASCEQSYWIKVKSPPHRYDAGREKLSLTARCSGTFRRG